MENKANSDKNLLVAQTILEQLGGNQLLTMMIGAKLYRYNQKDVGFRYMKAERNNSNHIQIQLMESDLYKLEFWNIRGINCKVVETVEGVYAENLAEVFQKSTGLTLSIPKLTNKF